MKNIKYILFLFVVTIAFSASSREFSGALDWYGYNSMSSSGFFVDNGVDDDDALFRKRRHKRRRKISPPKKGW